MKDEIIEGQVSRKNAQSVFQQLRNMDDMIREQKIMLDNFCAALATINNRLTALEQAINIIRIKEMGNGPTVI